MCSILEILSLFCRKCGIIKQWLHPKSFKPVWNTQAVKMKILLHFACLNTETISRTGLCKNYLWRNATFLK